ncbi:hypothetical protein JL720_16940 [Aureococcus anophagefferens]|nr:hypothetical protein JL720_16940 [Aureococcus anophagefferens]
MKGAEGLGVETKGDLSLFLAGVACAAPDAPAKVVPRPHFDDLLGELGIDASEGSVTWIASHFAVPDALTPEAEEQTILANLHDKLCDGAAAVGISTKEELCAFLMDSGVRKAARWTRASSATSPRRWPTPSPRAAAGTRARPWTRSSSGRPSRPSTGRSRTTTGAALVGQVYTNDDGSVDAVHLLHDLRLWPGVEESEHWNALAEDLRAKLCEGAAAAGIKTKEALCALFADDEGHPKKMRVDEFVEVCRESLGVDVAAPDDDEDVDDGDDPGQGELVAFVRCFAAEDGATPTVQGGAEAGEADAQPVVDLEKLLQHLELFDHDAADGGGDDDDDDDADTVDAADASAADFSVAEIPHLRERVRYETFDSPIGRAAGSDMSFVPHPDFFVDERTYVSSQVVTGRPVEVPPTAFHRAGPRSTVCFGPGEARAAIVTCGGVCPGLNTDGYAGFKDLAKSGVRLDDAFVEGIHARGGTVLRSSRGRHETPAICDALEARA